jgi:hypothetical protein
MLQHRPDSLRSAEMPIRRGRWANSSGHHEAKLLTLTDSGILDLTPRLRRSPRPSERGWAFREREISERGQESIDDGYLSVVLGVLSVRERNHAVVPAGRKAGAD